MSDRTNAYADALLTVARAEGRLDDVEDELFRFARSLEASDGLRATLTDELIPPARRQAVVEDLLGGKASPTTVQLLSFVVGSGRASELPDIVAALVDRAAGLKSRALAEVRSAVPLADDQKVRLAAALANATGKQIELKVVIDPTVLGGLVAQVGDTVIDGSIRARLDQIKSLL